MVHKVSCTLMERAAEAQMQRPMCSPSDQVKPEQHELAPAYPTGLPDGGEVVPTGAGCANTSKTGDCPVKLCPIFVL